MHGQQNIKFIYVLVSSNFEYYLPIYDAACRVVSYIHVMRLQFFMI